MASDKKSADAEKPEGGEATTTPAKSKKKLIIIAALGVLLLGGGGGAAAYFMGMFSSHPKEEGTEDEHAKGEKGKTEKEKEKKAAKKEEKSGKEGGAKKEIKGLVEGPDGTAYYELPSFLVNLNTPDSRKTSFLKVTVSLELPSSEEAADVELVKPRLIDTFNTYLRELRPSDVSGSAGIYRLREELMLRVNQVTEPVKVSDILFKEIVVQ